MTTHLFQFICVYLLIIGALFCLIELRTDFDKSFLYAGITILLTGIFSSIDIWFLPRAASLTSILYWTRVQHIIAASLVPIFLLHIAGLGGKSYPKVRLAVFFVIVLSILFLTDFFIRIDRGEVRTTVYYDYIFIPIVLSTMFLLLRRLIIELRSRDNPEKKVLVANLAGLAAIFLCGLFDLFAFALKGNDHYTFRSAMVLGVSGFGIMYSILFSERFLAIITDRKEAYAKLKTAFKDLEEVNSLKKLGEASAMINHEIGNYLCIISGQAQLLTEFQPLSDQGRIYVNNILSTADRLNHFSQDILDLSKAQIIKNKKPIRISEVAKRCIQTHFAKANDAFSLFIPEDEPFIYGDWGKLEQVFRNIFKNSLDAALSGKPRIEVTILVNNGMMLILAEDDGAGCTKEQMEGLFKAFFTTKQGKDGTGLGLSITRTIIQAHGGNINAYSKNLEKEGSHGLKLQITLPVYQAPDTEKKSDKAPILLIKEGIPDVKKIMEVFQNVNVNPWIVQTLSEADRDRINSGQFKIILHTTALSGEGVDGPDNPLRFILSEYNGMPYIVNPSRNKTPEVFSEEYILRHLL